MDIREYIKVKKGPGGSADQSSYHQGVLFTKNVVHKRMRSQIRFVQHSTAREKKKSMRSS